MPAIRLTDAEMNKIVYPNLLAQLAKAGGKLTATVRPNAVIGAIGVLLTDCIVTCDAANVDRVLKVCRLYDMPPLASGGHADA